MENKITGGERLTSCKDQQQQQLIDKLCSDYRRNLISRFQDHKSDDSTHKLPPSVLGANALIAEHLHSHGFFLSQSVFSSEIEFPGNCGKDNDPVQNYRLKQTDVAEIVGALNYSLKSQELNQLMDKYNKDVHRSLLSTLLDNACWKKQPTATSQKDLIAFNKYLKILVSRIAKVSVILSELKRKRMELNKPHRHVKSPHRHQQRRSRREDSQIQDLAKKIEKLTNRLTANGGKEFPVVCGGGGSSAKSYRDWIKELKESRHGQRMIRKIERIIVNSLNKEQAAMQKNFDEKLETQKMILKLHYKQKFLEHFQALNLSNEQPKTRKLPLNDLNGLPAEERERIPSRTTRKQKDERKRTSRRKKSSPSDSSSEQQENGKVHKLTSKRHERKVLAEEVKENQLKGGKEQGKEKNLEDVQERKIRLKNVERLINDAKERIKLLQSENERLDQSFNTYLENQSSQTKNWQTDVSAVWASYNVDRLLLEKKRTQELQMPGAAAAATPSNQPEPSQQLELVTTTLNVPEIRIEKCKSNLEVDKLSRQKDQTLLVNSSGGSNNTVAKDNSSGEFSNPFINFDVKKFLESTTKQTKDLESHSNEEDKSLQVSG